MDIRVGDHIELTYGGETRTGTVVLCSPNKESLMVKLDDGLWTKLGLYLDSVPLLMFDGQYRELIGATVVGVAVASRRNNSGNL